MSKIVSNVGEMPAHFVLEAIRAERIGYLTTFSFSMAGYKFRLEAMDRGQDAVFVLPVDWRRRVLYLVQQPRPNKALANATGRKVMTAVAAGNGYVLNLHAAPEDILTIDSPAGMIDGGETPEAAGIREVAEEFGAVLAPEALTYVGSFFVSLGSSTERHICYLASIDESTPRVQPKGDGDEHINTLEVSFEEAFAMIEPDGTCEHATLAALLREVKIQVLMEDIRHLEE